MDKKVINFVKSALRRTWGRSSQRSSALKKAKVSYGHYECAMCHEICRRKDVQIDHKIPVGRFKTFDQFIERLFVNSSGLQCLCLKCHKSKTKKDIKKMMK